MRSRGRQALILAMFVQAGCATTKIAGGASPSLERAELSVGDRTYHLQSCQSGDLAYFLGVDLADEPGSARVRVAIDPIAGPRLRVMLRQDQPQALTFDQDQCRQLHAEVTPTGWHVNTVRDVSGFVDAECTNAGQHVALHVRFAHCH